ncbi:MAG TPA: hypothetical protein VEY67_02340 [Candidatus Dormibacteraeota bacterium]|nr:hypothetical protein [Candidatus Dormibacteraeota bacterium]
MTPEPRLVALVAHARRVPSEAREAFAGSCAALSDDPRAIVLRTCHRVEVYAALQAGAEIEGDRRWEGLELPALPSGGRRLEGREAARHLFAVAAGLDSIVVGEDQILHQLRGCLSERHLAGFEAPMPSEGNGHADPPSGLDPLIERLFQLGLHVGRQARAWREGPPRSLSDVALDRIEASAGPLRGMPLLVVGAGRMGRLAALGAARRHARVLVANRTPDRAAALAFDADGRAVPYGPDAPLPDARAAIVAVSGRWDLGAAATAALLESDTVIVDLSSPPALEPAVRAAVGARHISIDDLASGPQDDVRARFRRRVERLVDESDAELGRWLAARSAVPAIQALTEHAETRRVTEVERLLRRLPSLDERDRELVDQMSRRLVASLLHEPLATLRDDETGDHERAARELFGL